MREDRLVGLLDGSAGRFKAVFLKIGVGGLCAIKGGRDAQTGIFGLVADVAGGGFEKILSIAGEGFEVGHYAFACKAALGIFHSGEVGFHG